jgi:hypothetical protein
MSTSDPVLQRHGVANFLYEIGKTKVLNKEEEVLLATHVQEHSRIARACQYFKKEEGRDPSDLELCSLFSMVSKRRSKKLNVFSTSVADGELPKTLRRK